MADTSEQQTLSEPHTNGVMDGLTEEEKSKMRPADIDADMREMERRKRVEIMMNSRLFREELERIIETQMKDGAGPSGLLQQISDMMGAQGARFNGNVFKNSNCVLPVNDIRGVESMGYAKGEKLLRCKLAAVFRLLDLYGWTQGVGGQITARLNQDQEHFLVNPYGLLYHEVTASSLIKVDMQGTIVEQGTTNFGVHVAGFQLHSTIHAARPDIKCIVHITTPSVTAISSLKCGLLPIGQESIVIGEVSTHQYIGGSFEPEEKEKIARNLGPMNKVMLLTNRGALCCGETVEEAFFNVYNMVLACETQLKLMPAGLDNLNLISEESKKAIFEASRKPPTPQQTVPISESTALAEKLEKRWRIGGTEFEALMRMLDNAGFRTGYIYRNPLVKGEPPRPRNDVEVPPAVSSLGYLLEEEELYKQGLWKGGRKGTDRSRWLNSPNVYQKVEILETGTPDPKKITKWVSEGSPTHSSTPVKIDGALQFVPKNTNPKEFKQIQQQIKDYRRADKISAGPQSHILEGVTWEEAKKMQDATISGTGEQVVLVGAASKGIIQRGFQHNAMVYKTPYAKNPFDAVTDQELDQYKKEVERKQKGDLYDESQSESEPLSSFNISRATHESSTAKSPIQSPVSVTSETEEESRDEPRVLRIETKQVPAPSQPEVVLSDDRDSSGMYRSQSEREYDNESDGEKDQTYVDREYHNWQVPDEQYRCEPRLEIARSDIVAERLTATLIEYSPPAFESSIGTNNRTVISDKGGLPKARKVRSWKTFESNDNGSVLLVDVGRENPIAFSSASFDSGKKKEESREETSRNSELRRIANMINRINSNVPSSETTSCALSYCSDMKISTKYNLDPADMTLIYSLTPFMNSDDQKDVGELLLKESLPLLPPSLPPPLSAREGNVDNDNTNGASSSKIRRDEEENRLEYKRQRWNKKEEEEKQEQKQYRTDKKTEEYIWTESPLYDSERYELLLKGACPEFLANGDTPFNDNEHFEALELFETSGEYFRNDISDSANEIIAALDLNDTYVAISYLVNEIFQNVYDTLFNIELNEQCNSLSSTLTASLRCSTSAVTLPVLNNNNNNEHRYLPKENCNFQTNQPITPNTPVFIVHEVIHHVIDAYDEFQRALSDNWKEMMGGEGEGGEGGVYSFKNAKNNVNVDLREARNNTETIESKRRRPRRNEQILQAIPLKEKEEEKEDLIERNEGNNQSIVVTPSEMIGTTEADAIFEFRTIAKRRETNAGDKAFELHFRVEKNSTLGIQKIEKQCGNTLSSTNASSSFESASYARQTRHLNNSSELNAGRRAELTKLSKLPDHHVTEISKSSQLHVECTRCMKFCTRNHDEEHSSLPPIDEERTEEIIANLTETLNGSLNDSAEKRHNDIYMCCCSADQMNTDEELFSRDLEDSKVAFSPEIISKSSNDQSTLLFSNAEIPHRILHVPRASLEFA